MKAKLALLLFIYFIRISLSAQNIPIIEVPDEIEFAGMKLKLTDGAKEILRKDIAGMTKNPKYFYSKVDLANIYFPLIEKVFEEESFPADFKYLALQESSLIGDAISKSNAVGYWQFKKESAVEVGLRVDTKIDERMNVIASSRGAARYLKRNNQTFNNWTYALLSYNLGLTGAKSQIDQSNIGATTMTVDENMHWYVLRFLAHKIIYQHAIENSSSVDSVLVEYIDGANKSLGDIASEHHLDKTKIEHYNKWLKTDLVPEDKIYSVILTVPMSQASVFAKTSESTKTEIKEGKHSKEKYIEASAIDLKKISTTTSYTFTINGIDAILALEGDNSVTLSTKGDVSKENFLAYNEMQSFEDVIPNRIYYLERKKKKAMVLFHTVQEGETFWSIAQNYGIKIETILDKNRMDDNEALEHGRVLWIRIKRPKSKPIEYKAIEKMEIVTIKNISSGEVYIEDSSKFDYSYHTVLVGETLFGISKKHEVTTDSLMKWNNLENYTVTLGETLIAGIKEKTEEPVFYSVITGDTFYKIARLYNVSVSDIQQWNNKTDLSLKLGEKLLIKKK